MAIGVTLDTFETAQLTIGALKQFIRPCIVEGIDVSGVGGNKSEALWLASEAIGAAILASPLASTRSDVVVNRIFLEPLTDTSARGRIVYETPQFGGGPPSTYLIKDGGYMRTLETNQVPGSRDPINVTYTGSSGSGSGSGAGSPFKITDRVTFQIMAPMRTILLSALIYGRPTSGAQEATCYLNDASWPTSGGGSGLFPKAKGFWRLDRFETEYSVYAGYFTLAAQATTKVVEDWSEFGTLRNPQTGKFVPVSSAVRTALLAPAYSYGVTTANGCCRVGFNPLISFPSLFGF